MSEYQCKYTSVGFCRNFVDPPLDYDDINEISLLSQIESVETYIEDVYELTSASDCKIPATLLVLSKILQSPSLAKKHFSLKRENYLDYNYERFGNDGNFGDVDSWTSMAKSMLRQKSYVKNNKVRIYLSD